MKENRFFIFLSLVICFCRCSVQPISIDEIMEKAINKNYIVVSQSAYLNNLENDCLLNKYEYIDMTMTDTMQLRKILGINCDKKILVFNKEGVLSISPFENKVDIVKINNSIRLAKLLSRINTTQNELLGNIIDKYNIYGLYLLFTQTKLSKQKKEIAEYIWFNSTNEEKSIYSEECLSVYKYIYRNLNVENIKFNHYSFHFIDIPMDTVINATYSFENIGKEKTLVEYVNKSCNCVNVFYPKYPISGNCKDSIIVGYKPNSKGFNSANIVVKFLYNEPVHLRFTCIVK